jgi:hypothetical protein
MTQDRARALEVGGWHVTYGLFGEPIAIYCTACADAMLARMATLREVWIES